MVPLMFNGVGGSMVLYAGDWPRMPPSDFRVRTLDGVADDWPLTYEELEPFYDRIASEVGVSGLAGDPAYPEGRGSAVPALPLGDGIIDVVRAHDRLGWHWWPAPSAILSLPYDGRHPCARVGHLHAGLSGGCEGVHRRHALARGDRPGARLVTGARVVRLVVGSNRLVHGRRVRRRRRRDAPRRKPTSSCSLRTRSGLRASCSRRAATSSRTGSPTRAGLSAGG